MENLVIVIPEINNINTCIISDRGKGIIKVVQLHAPNAYKAFCYIYLIKNIKDNFGEDIKKLFIKLIYTEKEEFFKKIIENIKEKNRNAFTYIDNIPSEYWSNYNFKGKRYDYISSNLAEILNSMLIELRELLVIQLLNGIWVH